MKIGVELYHMIPAQTGGMYPLIEGVLEALFAGWPEHEVTLFCTPLNECLLPAAPAAVRRVFLPAEADGYYPLLGAYARRLGLDVLVSTYPHEHETGFPLSHQVVLVPDCQHEFFPEFFAPEDLARRRRGFALALGGAGALGTLSEHARLTLRGHPACRCDDLFLVSPALRTEGGAAAEGLTPAEQALLPAGDFFLYPANLWPHKNHRRTLEAFARFLEGAGRPVEFVFTGHPEGWGELARDFTGLPIRHLGYVRRGFLQVLLARARALVFFSLFEGFGMPLLEAFAAGTPVLCSATTSLPEVGGDAVLACDPTDVAAMSGLMARVLADEALCECLKARGRERLARYDWHASAAQLVAACRRVLGRAAAPAAELLRPLEQLRRHVLGLEREAASRLKIIRGLEADCAARLDLIQRLDAECGARLERIQHLGAALASSEAGRSALHAEAQRLGAALACSEANREALRAEVERRDAARARAEAGCQALEDERRRLQEALRRAQTALPLRVCRRLVRGALLPFRRPAVRAEVD